MKRPILSIVVSVFLCVFSIGCGPAHDVVHKTGHVAAHGLHKTGNALHHAGEEIEEHAP
jgi:hypothetical protein